MATINNDIRKVGPQKWADLQRANQLKQTGRIVSEEDYITDPEDLKRLKSYRPQSMTEFRLGQPVDERIQSDVYRKSGGEDRYGDSMWDPEEIGEVDIDNIGNARGENQWTSAKWAAGLVKGANIAGTTLIDGTIGLAYGGVKGILTGNANALWDNEVSNAMSHWEEQMEKYAPNYRTDEELSNAWYQNLGTANFWADNVLKNMGFTVGAFYSGSAANKVIGKGLSFLRGNTAQKLIGTTVNSVNEGRKEANSFLKEARDEEYTKLEESYARAIQDINDKYANMDTNFVPVKDAEGNIVRWEDPKYKAYDEEMANLKEQFERRKKEIDDNIASQGLQVMVGSTIVTSISDWFTISKLYGTSNKMTKDFIARGYTPEEAAKLTAKALEKEEAADLLFKNGRFAVDKITKGKAIAKGLSVAGWEGPYEEMMQAVNSEYAKLKVRQDDPDAYYKALTDKNYQLQADKSIEQLGQAFSNVYLSPERWEEGFTGAIIGGLGVPKFGKSNDNSYTWFGKGKSFGMQGGLFGEISNAEAMNAEAEKRAKAMNDYLEKRDKQTRHFAQSMAFMEAADGYDPQTQKFEQKNAKDNADFAGLAAYADAGRLEDYKQLISEDFANMSDEDLNTAGTVIRNKEEIAARTKLGEYDNDGILTEKGREVLRSELEEKKQKMLKAADIFERAYTRAYNQFSPYGLSQDDIMELAWLDWKRERFNDRGISLRDSKKDKLTALYNTLDKASEAMQRMDASNLEGIDMNEALINEIQERKASIKSRLSFLKMRQGKAKSLAYSASKKPGDEGFEAWQAKLDEYRQREEETKKLEAEYDQLVEKEQKAKQGTKDRLVARYKYYAELVNDLINTEDPLSAISSILQLEKSLSRDINKGKMPLKYLDLLTKDDILTVDQNTGTAVLSKDIREMFEDLNLIEMAARQYTEKWIDYVTHPEKLQQNHEEVDNQNRAQEDLSDRINKKDFLAKASVVALSKFSDEDLGKLLQDPDLSNDIKTKVKEARRRKDKVNRTRQHIEEQRNSQNSQAVDDALQVFDKTSMQEEIDYTDLSAEEYNDPTAYSKESAQAAAEHDPSEHIATVQEILSGAFDKSDEEDRESSALNTSDSQSPLSDIFEQEEARTTGRDSVEVPPSENERQGNLDIERQLRGRESVRKEYINIITEDLPEDEKAAAVNDWELVLSEVDSTILENPGLDSVGIRNAVIGTQPYNRLQELYIRASESQENPIPAHAHLLFYINNWHKFKVEDTGMQDANDEPTVTQPADLDEVRQSSNEVERQTNELADSYENGGDESVLDYWKPTTSLLPIHPIPGDMTPFHEIVKLVYAWLDGGTTLTDDQKARAERYYNTKNLLPNVETFRYPESAIRRMEAVYKYIQEAGGFTYVDTELSAGEEVRFKIDPKLNDAAGEVVILITNSKGVPIGDLMSLKDLKHRRQPALEDFIKELTTDYDNFHKDNLGVVWEADITSNVRQVLKGKLPRSTKHKIQEVVNPSDADIRIYKRSEFLSEEQPKTARSGQAFLMLKTGKTTSKGKDIKQPVPIYIPTFSTETQNTVFGQHVVETIYGLVNSIGDQDTFLSAKAVLENLLVFPTSINSKTGKKTKSFWIEVSADNSEITFKMLRRGDTQRTIIYKGQADAEALSEALLKEGLYFNIKTDPNTGEVYDKEAIAEIAEVNVSTDHTVSNWFTVNPIIDGKQVKGNTYDNRTQDTVEITTQKVLQDTKVEKEFADIDSPVMGTGNLSKALGDVSYEAAPELLDNQQAQGLNELLETEQSQEQTPPAPPRTTSKIYPEWIGGKEIDLQEVYDALPVAENWEEDLRNNLTRKDLEVYKAAYDFKNHKFPEGALDLYFRSTETTVEYRPIDVKQEEAWLKKVLPQLSSSERLAIIDTLIEGKNAGELAWGMFYRGVMYISSQGDKGTLYHEAFHAVTRLILSPEEREKMFKEGASHYNLTNKVDIEEAIAEDFRRYVQLEEKPVVGFFVRLFRMLKNVLNVFSKHPSYINKLFYDIQSGNFADKKLNTYTSIDPTRYSSATPPEIQKEMQEIKAKAVADGTFMKAPNGSPTNLTEHQWLQVRTKAFKKWFGDWENDPSNASKVVDENGEPLVVYHTTRYLKNSNFTTFDTNIEGHPTFVYFSSSRSVSRSYLSVDDYYKEGSDNATKACFLNMKNPLYAQGNKHIRRAVPKEMQNFKGEKFNAPQWLDTEVILDREYAEKVYTDFLLKYRPQTDMQIIEDLGALEAADVLLSEEEFGKYYKEAVEYIKKNNPQAMSVSGSTRDLEEAFRDTSIDGIKFAGIIDDGGGFSNAGEVSDIYAVRDSNQIKSATDNIGTFSLEDDDIRFRLVPGVKEWRKQYDVYVTGIQNANKAYAKTPWLFSTGYLTLEALRGDVARYKFGGGVKPVYYHGRYYMVLTTSTERDMLKKYVNAQIENIILGKPIYRSYQEFMKSTTAPSKQFPNRKHITSKQASMLEQWRKDVARTEREIQEEEEFNHLQQRRAKKLMWGNLSEELKESLKENGLDYHWWNQMGLTAREAYIKCHGI